ncbi:hypothetical protein [Calothrix sp. PCC 7507]|uniref:hypothetical protein n=1 Tax=Calothrix sp. PCC 7507 TaxID=99598 RepID=UPI00029F0675|nr:hypothetical protein [Calothrix sp. PCC 7507]AFY30985.1 hypothetical protein Cal7507_0490 [Calothrix sp. PCC 7507]
MKIAILQSLLLFFLIASNFGCNSNAKSVTDSPAPKVSQTAPANNDVAAKTEKIKFKTDGGSDLFALKQQADGAKLVDGKNQELAKIKTDKPSQIKIKNSSDKVLGYVVTEKDSWKLKNPEQKQDLYILKKQPDGNYQLQNTAKKEIYLIKAQDDGFEIQSPDKKLVYQVKVKEGKTSLRDAANKTIFSTKSGLSPIAFACFGFDVMTREQQAALAYAVNLTGGK